VLEDVFLDDFLFLLILLGFEKSQLFLFQPIGVDFAPNGNFSLYSRVELKTLALIVLGQGRLLRLFRFGLFLNWDFFSSLSNWFSSLFVPFFFELVLDVSDVSVPSSLLSGSVLSAGSTSSIKGVSFWDSLERSSSVPFVFDFVSGLLCSINWDV
jgi:hypothetical protein